jgi:prephenate dehydrogenase
VKIGIIGVGLIGGSLAMKLNDLEQVEEVKVFDINNLNEIEQTIKVIPSTTISDCVSKANCVFICTPVGLVKDLVAKVSALNTECLITDVGSVKKEIVSECVEITNKFIGGHPMAGSESVGVSGAKSNLFSGNTWVLTPNDKTDSADLAELKKIIELTDAFVLTATTSEHDRAVAMVSHMPQVISTALMVSAMEQNDLKNITFKLAAGGFRDMTRIAGGNPQMWQDIFSQNKDYILESLRQFKHSLQLAETALMDNNLAVLKETQMQAQEGKISLPPRGRPLDKHYFDLIIDVPDKPGAIAKIINLAAESQVDIVDLDIKHNEMKKAGKLVISLRENDYLEFLKRLVKSGDISYEKAFILTIDGTAGSGKTTLANLLNKQLDINILDTGLLYRFIGYICSKNKVDLSDENAVVDFIETIDFEMVNKEIVFENVKLAEILSSPENSQNASKVGVHPKVRNFCNQYYRTWVKTNGEAIIVGRDIGTVVFPKAMLKIFLDADPQVKATRREAQIGADNQIAEIIERDNRDIKRKVAPTLPAEDAYVFDTGDLSAVDLADKVYSLIWENL